MRLKKHMKIAAWFVAAAVCISPVSGIALGAGQALVGPGVTTAAEETESAAETKAEETESAAETKAEETESAAETKAEETESAAAAAGFADAVGNYSDALSGFTMTGKIRAVSQEEIDAFYADAVLVGDSVMLGFRNYCTKSQDPFLKNMGILCAGSFSVHNSFDPINSSSVHPVYQGKKRHVWDSIALMGKKHVFLFFGLNDIAVDNNTPALYQQLVANIKAASPEAQINIISMTYVARGAGRKRLNNTNIRAFNTVMKNICAEQGWGFVDMANPLADGNGDLAAAYCSDKYVHQTPAAYAVWTKVLREYAGEILSKTEAVKTVETAETAEAAETAETAEAAGTAETE